MALSSSLLSKRPTKFVILLCVFVVLLVVVVPGYFFYTQYQKTQKQLESPTDAAKEEVTTVTEAVGKLMLLPSDEEPTLATVSDKSKLANQTFFEQAQNGDKVLIYTKSKKAYLYRPSINKLIDIAPVNIGEQAPPPQPVNIGTSKAPSVSITPSTKPSATPIKSGPTLTPIPTSAFQKVNVALYNGTRTSGLAAKTETTLQTKASNVTVVAKGNAANTYTDTLVIDFTGKYKKEAAELVKILGGSVGVLPKGEIKPTADILVILGPQ